MKKVKLFYLFLFAIVIASCKKEEPVELTLDNYNLTMVAGQSLAVNVTQKSGNFTAVSSNKSIATVQVVGNKITVKGVAKGSVKVTVKDDHNSKVVNVTVNAGLALDKTSLTLYKGAEKSVAIVSGSGEYEVSSDATKVKAVLEGTKVKITGVAVGLHNVTITDKKATDKKVVVKVTVQEPVELKVQKTEFGVATEKERTVKITSGTGEYTITSADEAKVKAEVANDTSENAEKGAKVVKVTGGATLGATEVTLIDTETGNKLVLKVTNYDKVAVAENSVSTTCDVVYVEITSGSGKYAVKTDNRDAIAVTVPRNTSKVEITPKFAGSDITVTVTDKNTSDATTFKVTVTPSESIEDDNFKVSCNGTVYLKKDVKLSGDVTVVAGGKIIEYYSKSPFKGNKEVTSIDFNDVTEIKKWALYGCTALKKVILRKVTNVGAAAFYYNTPELKEIVCYMEDPASVELADGAFKEVPEDAVLYVPAGKVDAYKSSKFGDFFTNIQEIQSE